MKKARDFNMKEKSIVTKGSAIFFLVTSIVFLLPIILISAFFLFISIITADFWSFVVLIIFSLPFIVGLTKVSTSCVKVIVSNEAVTVSEFNEMLSIFSISRTKKGNNGDGVEGIIEGREFDLIDKDDDGNILVSEFYPLTEKEVLNKILEVDNLFSKIEFKSYVKSVFMLIQKALSNNDYHMLRAFEADSLYYRHKAKIEDLIRRKIIEKREDITIKGALLKDFKIDGGKEIIVVALTARMDVSSNESFFCNVSGDFPYIMTFARNKGVKTKTGIFLSTSNCCNCGAVIDVDDDGVCNYCNTSVVSGELDWVLVDIKNIKLSD